MCDGYTMMEKAKKRARWGLVADGVTKSLSQRYEEFLERKRQDKCSKGDSEIEDSIRKRVQKYNEKENEKENISNKFKRTDTDSVKKITLKKEPTAFKNFNLETEKAQRQLKPNLDKKKVSAKVSGKVLGSRRELTRAPTVLKPFELSKTNFYGDQEDQRDEKPCQKNKKSDEDEDVVEYEDIGVHMPNKVEALKQTKKQKNVDMRTTE